MFVSIWLIDCPDFSNMVNRDDLKEVARVDDHESVKRVYEYFADYFPINYDLFDVDVPRVVSDVELTRSYQGLLSVLLSMRSNPAIRYQAQSKRCEEIAIAVANGLTASTDLLAGRENDKLLLVLDRFEDPVTPLITQWTYQAMVHELMGLEQNMVETKGLGKDSDARKQEKDDKNNPTKFVLSQHQDEFFAKTMFMDYGELGANVADLINEFQSEHKQREVVNSMEDIQQLVQNLPELMKKSGMVKKHLTLTSKMSDIVDSRNLMEISKVEQDLACDQNHESHVEMVRQMITNRKFQFQDKLRIVMLYALRYEEVKNDLPAFRAILRDPNNSNDEDRQKIEVSGLTHLCS